MLPNQLLPLLPQADIFRVINNSKGMVTKVGLAIVSLVGAAVAITGIIRLILAINSEQGRAHKCIWAIVMIIVGGGAFIGSLQLWSVVLSASTGTFNQLLS